MTRGWLIVLSCALLAVLTLAIAGVYSSDDGSVVRRRTPSRKRNFTTEMVDGLSVRKHGCYGIDFIKCGSCRMEKRKLGGLTLGCFNVLCLDDLSVVIPDDLRTAKGEKAQSGSNGVSAAELAHGIGIDRDFLKVRGQMPSFSGLRVTRLSVSTLDARSNAVLRCVAACGEAKRDGLHLEGCSVIIGSRTNFVGTALLAIKPELKVAWRDGEMRL